MTERLRALSIISGVSSPGANHLWLIRTGFALGPTRLDLEDNALDKGLKAADKALNSREVEAPKIISEVSSPGEGVSGINPWTTFVTYQTGF